MKKDPFTPSKKTIRKPGHTKVTTKLNNNVRKSLAMAMTKATDLPAFNHFTYTVDWSNFPNSLIISCYLRHQLPAEELVILDEQLCKLLQINLIKLGIKFRDYRKNIKVITPPKP
jgi:hypothetical protein